MIFLKGFKDISRILSLENLSLQQVRMQETTEVENKENGGDKRRIYHYNKTRAPATVAAASSIKNECKNQIEIELIHVLECCWVLSMAAGLQSFTWFPPGRSRRGAARITRDRSETDDGWCKHNTRLVRVRQVITTWQKLQYRKWEKSEKSLFEQIKSHRQETLHSYFPSTLFLNIQSQWL